MPPRRVSQFLHRDETPLQESIFPPPPNQSSTLTLPTIIEGAGHPAFGHIPETHLHQPITTSTTAAESSHGAATSSQAINGASCQSLSWVPSPIHTLPGDADLDHVQIDDWDEEVEEEAATAEEEQLARLQWENERLRQE
jgi:hypothetical protein